MVIDPGGDRMFDVRALQNMKTGKCAFLCELILQPILLPFWFLINIKRVFRAIAENIRQHA